MGAKQLWTDEHGNQYVPGCSHCGESLRSSPTYDGSSGWCIRQKCQAHRAETLERAIRKLLASATPHPVHSPTMWIAWRKAEELLLIPASQSNAIRTANPDLEAKLLDNSSQRRDEDPR